MAPSETATFRIRTADVRVNSRNHFYTSTHSPAELQRSSGKLLLCPSVPDFCLICDSAMSSGEETQTAVSRLNAGVLEPLKSMFVGKDEIIDLLGVCQVVGENLFLHGPPGTAKSALV